MRAFSHFSHFHRILLASRICHTRGSHIIKLAASPLHMRIHCLAPFNCSSPSHFSLAFCHAFLASRACHTRSHIYPLIASPIFALLLFFTQLLFIFPHHYFYTARLLIYSPSLAFVTQCSRHTSVTRDGSLRDITHPSAQLAFASRQ